jgi:hypothetical protein
MEHCSQTLSVYGLPLMRETKTHINFNCIDEELFEISYLPIALQIVEWISSSQERRCKVAVNCKYREHSISEVTGELYKGVCL